MIQTAHATKGEPAHAAGQLGTWATSGMLTNWRFLSQSLQLGCTIGRATAFSVINPRSLLSLVAGTV